MWSFRRARAVNRTASLRTALLAAGLLCSGLGVGTQGAWAQETATWYIPTYTHDILVWDEVTEEVVDRITMEHWIPNELTLNESRDRLYVLEATGENVEIVDLQTRQVVDGFTLSSGNVRVRIDGLTVHPSDERLILVTKNTTRELDRYVVEGPFILEYDLATKQVTDTLDWPDGQERDRGFNFRYSPDGETLYFVDDAILALDPETYEEIDRWDLSQPLEPGLGRANVSLNSGTYDEPGLATGLFRMTDPVQNRSMLGIGRVRLEDRDVDFFTLGTSEPVGNFVLAPGGEAAYALYTEIGRYEFWEFDLTEQRLLRRVPFAGRPRMGLDVSADGEKVYVHVAGNTIDVYGVDSFELLRTVEFDEDMTLGNVAIVPGDSSP